MTNKVDLNDFVVCGFAPGTYVVTALTMTTKGAGKRSVQLGHYYMMSRIYTMYCSRESSLTTPTISLWSTEHWGGGKKKRTHSHPRLGWIHFSYAYKR